MSQYTKGKWSTKVEFNGDWNIKCDGYIIARAYLHYGEQAANAHLITEAVNACASVNPDNPIAVAESIKEMYEALKQVERWFRLHSNSPTGEFAQQVIYKALSKANEK